MKIAVAKSESRPRRRTLLQGLLLSAATFCIGLVLLEFVLRAVVDKVDYMEPETRRDDILYKVIVPFSGGHDAWGMRNRKVPERADIVALGDSQTYGVAACARDSWPAQLQAITGQTVYNMAVPGHGPVQYCRLLETRALALHPKTVIVGFYAGNDFEDAYEMAYCYPFWAGLRGTNQAAYSSNDAARVAAGPPAEGRPLCRPSLPLQTPGERQPSVVGTQKVPGASDQAGGWSFKLRRWLNRNTVMYRMLTSSLLEPLKLQMMLRTENMEGTTVLKDRASGATTAFRTALYRDEVDLARPKIREGLRITLDRLLEMSRICRSNNITFVVLLIPTKEQVFEDCVERARSLSYADQIKQYIADTTAGTAAVREFLQKNGIESVDPLPALERAVGREKIYASNWEQHPNRRGYRIIAETVARGTRKSE